MFVRFADRRAGLRREDGYSLVELLTVAAVIGILGGISLAVSTNYAKQAKADGATEAIVSAIEVVHNRAVAERRRFELNFIQPNRIRVDRVEEPGGARTTVQTLEFENDLVYRQFTGIGDTPDLFGMASTTDFDGNGPVSFTSDGSLIDFDGEVSNGTIFIGKKGNDADKNTARAITIFGATGLIRHYKWAKTAWTE